MTNPTSPDSRTDPVAMPDPAAIDLQYLHDAAELADTIEQHDLWLEALAAVEALRERVADLKGVLSTEEVLTDEYVSRAKAAEARVVELAGALGKATEAFGIAISLTPTGRARNRLCDMNIEALSALTAQPTDALERARAVDDVVSTAQHYMANGGFSGGREFRDALAKLDAGQGERGTL